MSYPKITIARATVRDLRRKRDLPQVQTTFLTTDGPVEGTIWYDREAETRELMIVKEVTERSYKTKLGRILKTRPLVVFTSQPSVRRDDFLSRVADGRYILVGIQNDYVPSRTEF